MKKKPFSRTGSLSDAILAALACTTEKQNLDIGGLPPYPCPSATPLPTNTPNPTSLPSYPAAFQANLNYSYVDVTRSTVYVQYIAQSVGTIQLSYSGVTSDGLAWAGSGGFIQIGYAPFGSPGSAGGFPVTLPANVTTASIWVNGYSFGVNRYPYPVSSGANLSVLPAGPIYPTRADLHALSDATLYVRTNDYFLGDPIYTKGTLRVRFRVTQITAQSTTVTDLQVVRKTSTSGGLRSEHRQRRVFHLPRRPDVTSARSSRQGRDGGRRVGASLEAAKARRVTTNYDPVGLQAGQTQNFTLAAFGPVGTAYRLSYAMDSSQRGGGPSSSSRHKHRLVAERGQYDLRRAIYRSHSNAHSR
jgi:hypothetical protein